MAKLEILLANPGVRRIEAPEFAWFLSGCEKADAAYLAQKGGVGDGPESALCARVSDASIVKIRHTDGRAVRVTAWRGPTSKYDIFRLTTETGDLVLADHFRNAIARVPPPDRTPDDDALVDHFLFRAPVGNGSYCRRIERLGPGEQLVIHIASGETTRSIFHRMDEPPVRRGLAAHLDDVDAAFAATLGPFRELRNVATFFSGGVDSTLLQSYLGATAAALNLIVDVRDAAATMEASYAEHAAAALGIALERQQVRRADFLPNLERVTEKAGMPIYNSSLAVFDHLFARPYESYISGLHADGLFGHAALYHRVASWFANPLALRLLQVIAPLIARKDLARHNVWRERIEQLLPVARQLASPPNAIHGYAARAESFAEFDVAEAVFGKEMVARRLEKRLTQVLARVALSAPESNNFARHLEIGAWIELLSDDFGSQMRHLAAASGKNVVFPYISGDVVRSAQRIRAAERYVRGFEGKYILKQLLKRRLPSYPTDQRKGYTLLAPFPQYYTRGPLKGIWEQYDLPDCIAAFKEKDRILATPFRLTYNAISYAIWSRRVRDNDALDPLPGTRTHDWPFATS